jgi:hypothetical protein
MIGHTPVYWKRVLAHHVRPADCAYHHAQNPDRTWTARLIVTGPLGGEATGRGWTQKQAEQDAAGAFVRGVVLPSLARGSPRLC